MTTSCFELSKEQQAILVSFARKLKQLETVKSGRPQTIMVVIDPDWAASFWHGTPAGRTGCSPKN